MGNIKSFVKNLLLFSIIFSLHNTHTQSQSNTKNDATSILVSFELNEEKLLDIVNKLAGMRQANILLPNDQKKLNEITVTFKLGYKITLTKAWDLMLTMLDIAGYSLSYRGNNLYALLPTDKIDKNPAPLYINTRLELIKNNDATIRYLYYFKNIVLKKSEKDSDKSSVKANLEQIIVDMIQGQDAQQPEQRAEAKKNFIIDENHNSLLITGKATTIKSIIAIINELDQGGFREAIEVIPILHTRASEIVNIINQLIPKRPDSPYAFPPVIAEPKNKKTYFSSSTRILEISQTNSVAIFGLYESVQRIKDFIQKYLDKSVDAEKTILHIKSLKYLEAKSFAATLTNFIEQNQKGVESQSTIKGNDQILNGVIIQAEETIVSEVKKRSLGESKDIGVSLSTEDTDKEKGPYIGGNNLIVAATQRDWKIIDKLVDQLDTAQSQVALDVLVVDMTISTNKSLRSQLRRIANDNQNHDFKWQSAQIARAALDYTGGTQAAPTDINSARGVEADIASQQPGEATGDPSYNIPAVQPAGTTVFTYQDKNGTAAILALLENYSDVKILSRPFIITKNNEQANIVQEQDKLVPGPIDEKSMGGTPVVNYEYIKAAIKVSMIPRISRIADNINLEIRVDANEFVGNSDVITQRTVVTNANVGDQEVLVLGGIAKTSIGDGIKGFPILSKIPFIGYLFKSAGMEYTHRNLVIFISPTRISHTKAQIGTGPNQFTQNKVDDIAGKFISYSDQMRCPSEKNENFCCLSDPITDFIFPYQGGAFAQEIQEFARRNVFIKGTEAKKIQTQEKQIAQFKGSRVIEEENITTNKQSKESTDKLKTILKDEKNPLKKE